MTEQPAMLIRARGAAALEHFRSVRIPRNGETALYLVIFAAAVALRFWDLGSRALHHDESIHAQWSWDLIRGNYHHSPVFHGPFYYHLQGAVFFIFGDNDYTSRVSAALFGSIIVALPLLLRRRLGAVGTLAAVAFLALSPTAVYYSRFFREDIYMAAFVLVMVVAMWRYIEGRRDRWLVIFALAFTGAMATKEGTFLTVAVFLIFLDLYVAAELAAQTLRNRGMDSRLRHAGLTITLAPWAVPLVAFWPFLGSMRRSLDWDDDLPASGDLLILLGTFTLPLLTPLARPVLESSGLLDTDIAMAGGKFTSRLDWEFHLQGAATSSDRMALLGLFAATTGAAAFVGLQWRPKVWAASFGIGTLIYLTLMTSFWTNLDGLISGPWGSLDYWRTQQHVYRGDQPWFYYDLLMPAYEYLTLGICLGGLWWSVVRGNAFSRFLVFWLVGQWLALSYGSEKMPWLNTHLAVPASILAAWTVNRAWSAWLPRPTPSRAAIIAGSTALLAAGAMLALVFLPGGTAFVGVRILVVAALAADCAFMVWRCGRQAAGTVAVAVVVGGFALFSAHTMWQASFGRGDVPKDMLVYTQSSPDIPDIMRGIERLASATGKGNRLPIAVDSTDSFAWPWAWYLRDYKCVAYPDLSAGAVGMSACNGADEPYQVLLVNRANRDKVEENLAQAAPGYYGTPRQYPHRWWFDEVYKQAMRVDAGNDCTAEYGDCGPFTGQVGGGLPNLIPNVDTWKRIADGILHDGWVSTWYDYWRYHDPDNFANPNSNALPSSECKSCGSVDAFAYFPAAFDPKTGKLDAAATVKPVQPSVDRSGRPVFGGAGTRPGNMSGPTDIERDSDGNLYVVDARFKRLQKYDRDGNFITSVSVKVNPSDVNEPSEPWGVAVADDGTIVVADTFGWRIRIFERDLTARATFGKPENATGKPGPFDLFGPRDAAFDRQGNIWITDTGHDRIVVYNTTGQYVREFGTEGNAPGQFDEPVGLSMAADGTAFVADMYNGRVVVLDAAGGYQSAFPVDGWGGKGPEDKPYIRALRDGRVAVSLPSLNQVRLYDRQGALKATITGDSEPLSRPYGMVETADGKLWIVESGSQRVRQFALP